MKKILGILLIFAMLFSFSTAYAADEISVTFDFEGFAGGEPSQDSSTFDWMDYSGLSETPWTSANFVNNDTWLEPAERTDSEDGGTALRIVTKDATTAYVSGKQWAFMIRPKSNALSNAYPEIWIRFDWMVEDLNCEHAMKAYMQPYGGGQSQQYVFGIGANGILTTTAGATNVSVTPGEWHTYEMCMSLTDGLIFYMDGNYLNSTSQVYLLAHTWMFMQTLVNNGSGMFKGTAMQVDNYSVTSYSSAQDKRMYGIKEDTFTEGADNSSITFTGTPYNVTPTSKDYMMVLSVYDHEGRYVDYQVASGMQAMDTPEFPVSVTVNEWGEGYTAKLHILTSWTNRLGFIDKIYTYTDIAE